MYFILANECGLKWNEILHMDHFMLGVYYREAIYDRQERRYIQRLDSPL